MSDPARSGYECCGVPMQPIMSSDGEDIAFLCGDCLIWRHARPVGDPRRADATDAMDQLTRLMYVARQAETA